jgi:hypothetical protein
VQIITEEHHTMQLFGTAPVKSFLPNSRGAGMKSFEHTTVEANGAKLHVVQGGPGKPLLLLHGGPEFWMI